MPNRGLKLGSVAIAFVAIVTISGPGFPGLGFSPGPRPGGGPPSTFNVTIEGPLSSSLGDLANFTGRTSGGVAPFVFAWYFNGTRENGTGSTLSVRPLADGVFEVNVTAHDAIGARADDFLHLTVTGPGPVQVHVEVLGSSADGGAVLRAVPSGGTPPYEYLWHGPAAPSGWQRNLANWTTAPLGTQRLVVSVDVRDTLGYEANGSVTIVSRTTTVNNGSNPLPGWTVALAVAAAAAATAGGLVWTRHRRRSPR
jgi:hypothetical protein